MPVIGHEVGQYQVHPNFKEIAKYTGVLKPRNLEAFRNRLESKGDARAIETAIRSGFTPCMSM